MATLSALDVVVMFKCQLELHLDGGVAIELR
jgi:hypothetical protein